MRLGDLLGGRGEQPLTLTLSRREHLARIRQQPILLHHRRLGIRPHLREQPLTLTLSRRELLAQPRARCRFALASCQDRVGAPVEAEEAPMDVRVGSRRSLPGPEGLKASSSIGPIEKPDLRPVSPASGGDRLRRGAFASGTERQRPARASSAQATR
jgi:hypothetical protein